MGSEQQFCLRWNNFQHSLLTSLPRLLDADDLTDVTLCAGGKSLKAHRVVLSACSHYFKNLFRELQPFHHPVIVLPQTSYSDVCALVSFMYSGEVNIYQEQLPSLLAAAAALHIRGLAEVPHSAELTTKTSSPITPPSREAPSLSPPAKRVKISPVTRSSSPLRDCEPQNLVTNLKPAHDNQPEKISPRFDPSMQPLLMSTPLTGEIEERSPSLETSPHDTSDPMPLALHVDAGPFGHSASEDSHGSEPDTVPDKLLHAAAVIHQGLNTPLNHHPLNFVPNPSALFSPFTSLARNKLFATCHICGKSLSNQYNLRVHLETHQNLNYSCNLCAHVSRSRDALRKHIAYKHTEGRDKFLQSHRKNNTSSSTNSSPEDKFTANIISAKLKEEALHSLNNNSQQASC